MQAKKHIYCEKPAGADIANIRRLLQAGLNAGASKRIQFGFQQRFSPEHLTTILGRMSVEYKREITWEEMMRSA